MGDLVQLISKQMNTEIIVDSDENRIRPENSEVERLFCNNYKIISSTKWKPEYDLNREIWETIEWFKMNINGSKAGIYNV